MKKIESTKCNKCISSGGGDCATCDPPGTTAQQESEHCGKEDVCIRFRTGSIVACKDGTPCMRNHDGCKTCGNDTRKNNGKPDGYFITRCGLEECYDALALINGKPYADQVWEMIERDTRSRPFKPASQENQILVTFKDKETVDYILLVSRRKGYDLGDYVAGNFEWDDMLPCIDKINPEDCQYCDFREQCPDRVGDA